MHRNCEIILGGRITFVVPRFTCSKHAAVVLQHAPTVHVGGPAYVHTCVLSGSGGTAGVLAHSLNTSSSLFAAHFPSGAACLKPVALPLCVAAVWTLHILYFSSLYYP